MPPAISPLAHVDPRAEIAADVQIGPFCLVGPDVTLGEGCRLDSHVVLTGHTTIGRNNRFFPNCVIGCEPQDYSYSGAPTRIEIGDENQFREGVTVHRGAEKEDHVTRIGNKNMLMANCHVAHNCHIHNEVVLVNGVLLGGHVHVHDGAIISGNSAVHHFGTVGTLAFVAGCSRVATDVPPYMLFAGNDDARIVAVNAVGLQRRGISATTVQVLRHAHKLLFREHLTLEKVREHFAGDLGDCLPIELTRLLDFIEKTQAGQKGRGGETRRHLPVESGEDSHELRRAA